MDTSTSSYEIGREALARKFQWAPRMQGVNRRGQTFTVYRIDSEGRLFVTDDENDTAYASPDAHAGYVPNVDDDATLGVMLGQVRVVLEEPYAMWASVFGSRSDQLDWISGATTEGAAIVAAMPKVKL